MDESREEIRNASSEFKLLKVIATELVRIREIMQEDLKLKQVRYDLSQRRERFDFK